MHVRLRALDVVVEVVAEELNVRDRQCRDLRLREVAREEDEGDIADVFGVVQPLQVSDLERRFARGVEDLRRSLDCGQSPGIDELLQNADRVRGRGPCC